MATFGYRSLLTVNRRVGRVEKVGEVTLLGTISYIQSSLTLHRERKCPTWPTSVTFATLRRAGSGSYGLTTSTPMRTTFAVPWFSAQCSTSRDSVMKPPGPTVFA
jgi:hypothetical protein